MSIQELTRSIASCRICRDTLENVQLPHDPNPVCVISPTARICISGQAPGMRVHLSGKPFTDPSGDRLREWMGVDETIFYDASKIAIVPMGFCFPGYDKNGGDLPPRKECRAQWHDQVFEMMPQLELVLTIGQYAQAYQLGAKRKRNMTETVAAWREYYDAGTPSILPMPHPSWRNNAWLRRNQWFAEDLLPVLRERIRDLL